MIQPEAEARMYVQYLEMAFRQELSEREMWGLAHHQVSIEKCVDPRRIAIEFKASVLGTQPEEVTKRETVVFRYSAPRRPWYISRKRWARLACDIVEVPRVVEVDLTHRWVFPQAEHLPIEIGEVYPVRIVNRAITMDWRKP